MRRRRRRIKAGKPAQVPGLVRLTIVPKLGTFVIRRTGRSALVGSGVVLGEFRQALRAAVFQVPLGNFAKRSGLLAVGKLPYRHRPARIARVDHEPVLTHFCFVFECQHYCLSMNRPDCLKIPKLPSALRPPPAHLGRRVGLGSLEFGQGLGRNPPAGLLSGARGNVDCTQAPDLIHCRILWSSTLKWAATSLTRSIALIGSPRCRQPEFCQPVVIADAQHSSCGRTQQSGNAVWQPSRPNGAVGEAAAIPTDSQPVVVDFCRAEEAVQSESLVCARRSSRTSWSGTSIEPPPPLHPRNSVQLLCNRRRQVGTVVDYAVFTAWLGPGDRKFRQSPIQATQRRFHLLVAPPLRQTPRARSSIETEGLPQRKTSSRHGRLGSSMSNSCFVPCHRR